MFEGIRTCLGVSSDPMFLWISSNFCPINLLLRSHQAEIFIVTRLIQGRNNVTECGLNPDLCCQGRGKNDAYDIVSGVQLKGNCCPFVSPIGR